MAKSSGSDRTKFNDGGGNYKGEIKNIESLKNIENRELQREIQQGISKYESRIGVRTPEIMLAELDGAYGVHVTGVADGKSRGVYLDTKTFKKADVNKIEKAKRRAYDAKFLSKTNKPVQHTLIHELGHATWNTALRSDGAVKASKEIKAKFAQFLKEKPKGYGSYSRSNVNEFWAETTAKAVLGTSDKYTKFLKGTIKKYKL